LLAGLFFVVSAGSTVRAQDAEIAGIDRVYLREGPGADRPNLGVLNAGDRVKILGSDGSWTKVETREGKVGFVYHRYVGAPAKPASTSESPQSGARAAVTGSAADPLAPPVAAPASPAPATPEAPDEIAAEIANLRTEVADLKQRIEERSAESDAIRSNEAAPSGSPTMSAAGSAGFASRSAREQSAGVLVVALLSLLVGWVLGAAFTRRRSRSQRSRLRL
jgi:uncharacterized protein YgiM (DUF1202 family)